MRVPVSGCAGALNYKMVPPSTEKKSDEQWVTVNGFIVVQPETDSTVGILRMNSQQI